MASTLLPWDLHICFFWGECICHGFLLACIFSLDAIHFLTVPEFDLGRIPSKDCSIFNSYQLPGVNEGGKTLYRFTEFVFQWSGCVYQLTYWITPALRCCMTSVVPEWCSGPAMTMQTQGTPIKLRWTRVGRPHPWKAIAPILCLGRFNKGVLLPLVRNICGCKEDACACKLQLYGKG